MDDAMAGSVGGLLGTFLYSTSREVVDESQRVVEESKKVSDVVRMSIKDNYGENPELAAAFNEDAAKSDQKLLDQQRQGLERGPLVRQNPGGEIGNTRVLTHLDGQSSRR